MESVVRLKGLDIDTIQQAYTVWFPGCDIKGLQASHRYRSNHPPMPLLQLSEEWIWVKFLLPSCDIILCLTWCKFTYHDDYVEPLFSITCILSSAMVLSHQPFCFSFISILLVSDFCGVPSQRNQSDKCWEATACASRCHQSLECVKHMGWWFEHPTFWCHFVICMWCDPTWLWLWPISPRWVGVKYCL